MKFSSSYVVSCVLTTGAAFSPAFLVGRKATTMLQARSSNFDLTGNDWKPDSEKMGSTDTGDYYPEGYDKNAVCCYFVVVA